MAAFLPAYRYTVGHEGGITWKSYVDHQHDRGGETFAGVARKHNPGWRGWKIIDRAKHQPGFPQNLRGWEAELRELVVQLYRIKYWDAVNGDAIPDQLLAQALFDAAIHAGSRTAARWLQESLNLLNKRARVYSDIVADGRIGPQTLGVLKQHISAYGGVKHLVALLVFKRGARAIERGEQDDTQETFFPGWLNRFLDNLLRFSLQR